MVSRNSQMGLKIKDIMMNKCETSHKAPAKKRIIFLVAIIVVLCVIRLVSTLSFKARRPSVKHINGIYQEYSNERNQATQVQVGVTKPSIVKKDLKPHPSMPKHEELYCLTEANFQAMSETRCPFKPRMKETEKLLFINILKTFDKVCKENNLTYFIYGGTLLGSWRHHGFIPWDDDSDVMMNSSQKKQIYKILTSLRPTYGLWQPTGKYFPVTYPWKFFSQFLKDPDSKMWNWPFIDIFFYSENDTHIWDNMYGRNKFAQLKSQIFPLSVRPFESLWLPSPRKPLETLDLWYDVQTCQSNTWDHKNKRPILGHRSAMDCRKLHPYFPFVTQTTNCTEILMIGNNTVHSLKLEDTC